MTSMLKGVLLFLIRLYQAMLSPLFFGSCRFQPTCSHYAAEAVEVHGPLKGSWLALARLVRCQPFCRGGFDPVPAPRDPKLSFDLSFARMSLVAAGGNPLGRSETKPCQESEEARRVASRRKTTKQGAGRSPTPQFGDKT